MEQYADHDSRMLMENTSGYYESGHSPDFSKYRRNKRRYDPEIIKKLIGYVETTLDARLNTIEEVIDSNKKSLKEAKFMYSKLESKVIEAKARANFGKNLISDDIKFFFDLVQGKSKASDKRKECRNRTPGVKRRRDSVVKRRGSRSRRGGKENKNPNKKRRFFVGGSKATFDEHRKDKVRKRTPVRRRSRSKSRCARANSRAREVQECSRSYVDRSQARKRQGNEWDLGSKFSNQTRDKSRGLKNKGSYMRQSSKKMLSRGNSGSRQPKRWEQLYNMALEKDKQVRERSQSMHKRRGSKASLATSQEQGNSRNISRNGSMRSCYTFQEYQNGRVISNNDRRRSRRNLILPPQPKSSTESQKFQEEANASIMSYGSPNQLITQTMPDKKIEDIPSPSLFKNRTDEIEHMIHQTLGQSGHKNPQNLFEENQGQEGGMPILKSGMSKEDVINLLMDTNLSQREKRFLLDKEFAEVSATLQKESKQSRENDISDISTDTRILLCDYKLGQNISKDDEPSDFFDTPIITPHKEGRYEATDQRSQIMQDFEALDESFSGEVKYIKEQNEKVNKSLEKNNFLGDFIDIGQFEVADLLKKVMVKKSGNEMAKAKPPSRTEEKLSRGGRQSPSQEEMDNERMLKNIEELERVIQLGSTMKNLQDQNENVLDEGQQPQDQNPEFITFQEDSRQHHSNSSLAQSKKPDQRPSTRGGAKLPEGFKEFRSNALKGKSSNTLTKITRTPT